MRNIYPETVQVCVPRGFRSELASVAEKEALSVSAYVRRLIASDIRRRRADEQKNRKNGRAYDRAAELIAA